MTERDLTVKDLGWKILPWVANALCGLLCWWALGMNVELKAIASDVAALREWRAETSGNRYTAQDHAKFAELSAKEHTDLWKANAQLRQEWILELSKVREELGKITTQLSLHDKREATVVKP